ncbi:MAG: hypothetical protein JW995_09695 [Melioribacteraceae bacterium]|nr:hypothetical protein [Melioribacteraceae bacterium]
MSSISNISSQKNRVISYKRSADLRKVDSFNELNKENVQLQRKKIQIRDEIKIQDRKFVSTENWLG